MKYPQVTICAIICLSLLEVAAMHYGINGTMRTIIFTMIGTLAGLATPFDKIMGDKK